mgnify:CR=1 FL=1
MRSLRSYFVLLMYMMFMTYSAQACGFCIEDKIASVYDHALIIRAIGNGERVVFCSISSDIANPNWDHVTRSIRSAPSVDAKSVKFSKDTLALAFTYQADQIQLADLVQSLKDKLAKSRLTLEVIKTIDPKASDKTME